MFLFLFLAIKYVYSCMLTEFLNKFRFITGKFLIKFKFSGKANEIEFKSIGKLLWKFEYFGKFLGKFKFIYQWI